MFERYSEKARRAIFFARYEAGRFGAAQIGTEHLLLGIARDNWGVLARFLSGETTPEWFASQIEAGTPLGASIPTSVDLPLSDPLKRVLNNAKEESDRLGHKHIGTEHLFLGLLHEEDCLATKMLRERGAEIEAIRTRLAEDGEPAAEKGAGGGGGVHRAARGLRGRLASYLSSDAGLQMAGFHLYTERARRAIFFARYESSKLGHDVIESEHLLLGILRELERDRLRFLPVAISIESVREEIKKRGRAGKVEQARADLPLSDESKRALAYAAEEAGAMRQPQIGPGHLLLGLLREENCLAAKMLRERGADPKQIRKAESKAEPKPEPESGPTENGHHFPRDDYGEYT